MSPAENGTVTASFANALIAYAADQEGDVASEFRRSIVRTETGKDQIQYQNYQISDLVDVIPDLVDRGKNADHRGKYQNDEIKYHIDQI